MEEELKQTSKSTPRFSLNGIVALAKCVDVHDGDTAQFTFRPFMSVSISRFTIRFAGYNSAEINGDTETEREAALAAKKALEDLILDKIVVLHLHQYDKYGRILADVFIKQDSRDTHVNKFMIDSGHGKPYNGRGEKLW